MNPSPIRLQVFLSRNGICSRRKAMELIQQRRVMVNGKIIDEPSFRVHPDKDQIVFNDREVAKKSYQYVMLNKPAGYVTTTTNRFKQKTVLDLLPVKWKHLRPVGRLDKNTEGLLVFTNHGDLIHHLTHPRFHVDKTYLVRINGVMSATEKNRLEKGISVEGRTTAPAQIRNVKKEKMQTKFEMTIHEGRKRQIRLMLDALGHKVIYLKRIVQGPLRLGHLKPGQWRELTKGEVKGLINRDVINRDGPSFSPQSQRGITKKRVRPYLLPIYYDHHHQPR